MNQIQTAIRGRQFKLTELEREAAMIRDELAALLKAADILGLPEDEDTKKQAANGETHKKSGKPAGAISQQWRTILQTLFMIHDEVSFDQIKGMAECQGVGANDVSIRDRIRYLMSHNYLEKLDNGNYRITGNAIDRFQFTTVGNTAASPVAEEAV